MTQKNDAVHVDMVDEFRLLTPASDPNLVILRVKDRSGKVYNFGADRRGLTQAVRVWAFDLSALESAVETGGPLPGKPFGSSGTARRC